MWVIYPKRDFSLRPWFISGIEPKASPGYPAI
jgi:hypothetical protein